VHAQLSQTLTKSRHRSRPRLPLFYTIFDRLIPSIGCAAPVHINIVLQFCLARIPVRSPPSFLCLSHARPNYIFSSRCPYRDPIVGYLVDISPTTFVLHLQITPARRPPPHMTGTAPRSPSSAISAVLFYLVASSWLLHVAPEPRIGRRDREGRRQFLGIIGCRDGGRDRWLYMGCEGGGSCSVRFDFYFLTLPCCFSFSGFGC
jgi:hypothetical protein